MALRELGVRLEPELVTRSSVCRDCVWKIVDGSSHRHTLPLSSERKSDMPINNTENSHAKAHATHIQVYDAIDEFPEEDDDNAVWISSAWLRSRLFSSTKSLSFFN